MEMKTMSKSVLFVWLIFVNIQSKNNVNAGICREEIVANSMLMLMAGYDTTSSAMQFLVYNLAVHKECQEKLREEIKDTVKKHVSRGFMKLTHVSNKSTF